MKKLLSVLLAVLMLVSLSVPAFADGEELCDIPMPETGLTFHIPWGYLTGENTLGKLMIGVAEELAYNAGIYYTQIEYMRNGEEDDYEHYAPYLTFICLRSNCDQAMLSSPDFLDMLPSVGWNELATIGDYTHYVIIGTDEIKADFTDDELSEYFSLLDNVEDIIQTTDYYEPEAPHSEMTGQTISFQTKDLDGNPVNSADLFSANRITMLNMWETSCPHCIKELPDLAQIHERLQSMGCGIVGSSACCMTAMIRRPLKKPSRFSLMRARPISPSRVLTTSMISLRFKASRSASLSTATARSSAPRLRARRSTAMRWRSRICWAAVDRLKALPQTQRRVTAAALAAASPTWQLSGP